jgi:uncharacterized protein YbjT (DUF2867 family)
VPDHKSAGKVFLTGATGYIGGRLAPLLLDRGLEVTCLVRQPRKLESRSWADRKGLNVVQGDLADANGLVEAMRGCDTAYYLVHAMEAGAGDFAERDRKLATNFTQAAKQAGLKRIIYLGGLGELGAGLSEHLASRREVEDILRDSCIPTTAFRAAMILGSGSASFEILRYLVERLPIMVTPRWVRTRGQPISVVDVLGYLLDCLDAPETTGRAIEIGGPTILTYRELMDEMARQLRLRKRIIIPVPVLTPTLSSLWIGLITPVSPAIARPLAEGLRNEVVVRDDSAQKLLPRDTLSPAEAIAGAVQQTREDDVMTRWSAAGVIPGDPDWAGGAVFIDRRSIEINATDDEVFAAICRIGGGHGWYAGDILWKIRGFFDQLIGGPGLRRGRRHPSTVEFGETLDFWRVTDVVHAKKLVLTAEMKLPGVAELSFDIDPAQDGHSDGPRALTMTARFRPSGLLGIAYWYAVLPLHNIVFGGMLRGMKRAAEGDKRPTATAANG